MTQLTHAQWFAAGFTGIVPVIPPGAQLSAISKIRPESRGKVPGRLNGAGTWASFDWRKHQTTLADCEKWTADGASVGLRCGPVVAIDVDVLDPRIAETVYGMVKARVGAAPRRTGQAPKHVMLYRCGVPFGRMRLCFYGPQGDGPHMVEVLGEGQQVVVDGTHPRTGKPYTWDSHPADMFAIDDLPLITKAQCDELLVAIAAQLELFGCTKIERQGDAKSDTEKGEVNQLNLMGDLKLIAEAVRATPNDNDNFPDRDEDYIPYGYAIKAATVADPGLGLELWLEWSAKWEGNDKSPNGNSPEAAEGEWDRMHGPYRVGATYLYTEARKHGWLGDADAAFTGEPAPPEARRAVDRLGDDLLKTGSDVEVAERFRSRLEARRGGPVIFVESKFWFYDRTAWKVIPLEEMRLDIHGCDGQSIVEGSSRRQNKLKLDRGKLDGILSELRTVCAVPGFFDDAASGLNCASGFIRFGADGEPELVPHSPDHRCRRVVGSAWRPGEDPEPPEGSMLKTLLHGCFLGDEDASEKIALMQELAGAAAFGLAMAIRNPKAVIFFGERAGNGKNQILDMIAGLPPAEAVSSIAPQRMGDDKYLVQLAGKTLNMAGELSARAVSSPEFKAVITGDPISARDVYSSVVNFRPFALHVFATNAAPTFQGGFDNGIARRLLPVVFNRVIPSSEQVLDIGRRVAQEETALLLRWAVEGARRLMRAGRFTEPKSSTEALRDWTDGGDPVRAWLNEQVHVEPGARVRTQAAFAAFVQHAAAGGYDVRQLPKQNSFTGQVKSKAPAGIVWKKEESGAFFQGMVITVIGFDVPDDAPGMTNDAQVIRFRGVTR